jgi:hypothetical protein
VAAVAGTDILFYLYYKNKKQNSHFNYFKLT